jgi:2-keto-4-pentenoate hydratase
MHMERKLIEAMAEALFEAEKTRRPIAPLTADHPEMTLADAYAVQMLNVRARAAGGARMIGKKVGLTSRAMQRNIGVNEPDYGHLFSDMIRREGEPVSLSSLIQPKIEAELAFILAGSIKGPGVSLAEVLRNTAAVMPAFELIDSRIRNWEIRIQDTVADNGSSAGLLLGSGFTPVAGIDLKYVGLVLEKNGEVLATAAGAEILGHPAQSVAWLANALGANGIALEKGEIVLSGSFTQAFPVAAGEAFTATFGGLGRVGIAFRA